jgi:3-phenylpropionate/trans-cinnamate dioxygenase ferredoxin subunit
MERVVVAKVSEIPAGGRKIVAPFRGRAGIGVFNVAGSFYALRNICPHKNGPLCTGEICGRIGTDAPPSTREAAISVDGLGEVLRCPWHQWPFDIATGRCLTDPTVRVKTFPVKIDGDDIVIEYEA